MVIWKNVKILVPLLRLSERSLKANFLGRVKEEHQFSEESACVFDTIMKACTGEPQKRIIRERRFGFILAEDGMEPFFHRSELQNVDLDKLEEGDHLEFSIIKGNKGSQATAIKKTSEWRD
jgi:cold shock CspA family protein